MPTPLAQPLAHRPLGPTLVHGLGERTSHDDVSDTVCGMSYDSTLHGVGSMGGTVYGRALYGQPEGGCKTQAGVDENSARRSVPTAPDSHPTDSVYTLGPTQTVCVPLRTCRGLNTHDAHWSQRSRRVKHERETTAWALHVAFGGARPSLPVLVTLSRCGPTNGLDDDNLVGSLKAARDAVAHWLCVDDADPRISFAYTQCRTPRWWVSIAFAPRLA